MNKPALLLFTSLYPTPWQPSRATFNFQQYQALSTHYAIQYLVPLPWYSWLRHLPLVLRQKQYPNVCYFPMFYIPGILRSFNGVFLLLSMLLCVVPAWRLLRAKRVLASWAFPDALVAAWLKPLGRYKLIIQCLGSDVNVHQQIPVRRRMLCQAFSKADAVVTVSEDLACKVRAISPEAKAITIYNGVNFERFALQSDRPVKKQLIFIGNLLRTKGVYELVQAMALLQQEDAELHILGGGPEQAGIKQLAAELAVQHQVILHGRLPHEKVGHLLQQAQLLVLPSYQEGVPNVIMEAMACGVPVVATAVGGIPEVVASHCGILLTDHRPETIAAGIRQAWQQQWDGKAIRQSIRQLTWSANSEQVHALFEQGIAACQHIQQETRHG